MKKITLKVGDKVKWRGNYFKNYKPGKSKEDVKDGVTLFDVCEYEYKEGIDKIAYIGTDVELDFFNDGIIKLENGKIFSINTKDLTLV